MRLDLLVCLAPLVADLVVTGAGRGEIGLLIFPNLAALAKLGFSTEAAEGALAERALQDAIKTRLASHAKGASSSARVARAIVLNEPASMPAGEVTAKGNLNFRKVLTRRADMLARLYSDNDPAVIIV